MVTIAVIGPDGAGKSTLIEGLLSQLDIPVKYIYMGVNPDAMNVMLPTTRLMEYLKRKTNRSEADAERRRAAPAGRQDAAKKHPKSPIKRLLAMGKSLFFTINRIAEQWYRVFVAWTYERRGYLILFDRHFFLDYRVEVYAQHGDNSIFRRILNWQLEHLYPRPNATLYLDAPGEVLFARKGEGTVELLNEKREAYQSLTQDLSNFIVLDATQDAETVLSEALQHVNSLKGQK